MRILLIVFFIIPLAWSWPQAARKSPYDGDRVLRLHLDTEEEVEVINDMMQTATFSADFWSGPRVGGDLELHLRPSNQDDVIEVLNKNHITYKTVVDNLQELVDEEHKLNEEAKATMQSPVGTYPRYDELLDFMDLLAATSFLATQETIGTSSEGRSIRLLKISSGASSNKKAIFIDAGIHPREWISVGTIVWIMDHLVNQYGISTEVTELVDKFDFYILPIANPDGWEYTHTNDRFWRKTRRRNSGSSCVGTDPNRNFDYPVFGGPSTSSNPCSDIYKGPNAFSEPETAAIKDYLLNNRGRFQAYVALHSFTQLWLTPWGFENSRPSDASEMDRVANIGAQALMRINNSRYTVGTPPEILYAAAGGAYDWAKGTAGIKYSYTLELRPASGGIFGFIVNPSQITPSGREVFAGIRAMALEMRD